MSIEQKSKKPRFAVTAGIVVMVIVGMATAVFSVDTEFKSYDIAETTVAPDASPADSAEPVSPVTTSTTSAETTTVATTVTTTVVTTAAQTTTAKTETAAAAQTADQTETQPQTQTKAQTVKGTPVQGDYACFNNSAFLGNSRFEGLRNLRLVPNVYAKVGLTVKTALTESDSEGASIIGKLNSGESFDNIFIMFGDNEIGYSDSWIISNYKTLISTVKSYQPDAKIYVVSILPISRETSEKNVYNYSNSRIVNMNAMIREMCSETGASYLDVWSAMADDNGCLPSSASSDGIHFGKSYYCIMLNYINSSLGY